MKKQILNSLKAVFAMIGGLYVVFFVVNSIMRVLGIA